MKNFSIIVALAENNAIGKNNDMLWHISQDFKYFKETTINHTLIMGRNTWLSLPVKPLPGRKSIVVSSSLKLEMDNVVVVPSIEKAIELCSDTDEVFIVGGGQIYKQFLPLANKLYITKVHKAFDAEIFFPEFNKDEFNLISESERFTDAKSGLEFTFLVYERK